MKNSAIQSSLFALIVAVAVGCASNELRADNDDPNPPAPGNAYLTIVGDSQYFLEGGWRQTLTVRYHDGADQPLAGQVDFAITGAPAGASLTSAVGVTSADGQVNIDVIAGAQGDAVFKVRAEAEYAEPVEWTIAVTAGTPPPTPLDPTGRFTVHSDLDLVSGVPGTVGQVINTFLDMTDDPNDPATWIIDLVLEELDNSTVEGLIDAARPFLDGLLNDLLLSIAPDFVNDILELGDMFGEVSRNFGVVTTLDVEQTGGIEGNELSATHTMTGMFFNLQEELFSFSMAELGVDNIACEDISFIMEDESVVNIGAHTFAMPYGALMLLAIEDAIIPMLDPYATDLTDFVGNLVNCYQVGLTLEEEIGVLSSDTYEDLCLTGVTAAVSAIEDQINGLAGMDLNIEGQANPKDTNSDSQVDKLLNGEWTGNVSYFGSEAPLTDATFRGELQNLP